MSSFPVLEMAVRCYIGYRIVLYLSSFRRRDKLKRSIRGALGGGQQLKITQYELDTAISNLRRTGSHRALSRCNSSESWGSEQAKGTKEIKTAEKTLGRLKLYKIGLRFLAIALITAFFLSLNGILPSSPLLVDDPKVEVCGTTVASSTQEHCVSERGNTFDDRLRLSVATFKFVAATSIRTVLGPLARLRNRDQRSIADGSLELYLERIEREAHDTWEAIAAKSGQMVTDFNTTIEEGDTSDYNTSIVDERSHEVAPSTVDFGIRKRTRKGRKIIRHTVGKLLGKIKCKIRGCSVRVSEEDHHEEVSQYFASPPELDLNMIVPCHYLTAEILHRLSKSNTNRVGCILRDLVTRELLVEYAKHLTDEFDMATHPILLRNIWPQESFAVESNRRLTVEGLLKDPELSTLDLPNHFPDASQTGYSALVPDNSMNVTLSRFVSDVLSGSAPNAKIGTQLVVEAVPELTEEIVPRGLARELFGWNPWLKNWLKGHVGERIQGWIDRFPSASCYPVFVARQHSPSSNKYPRTDLHAEPIGNIAIQLEGSRRWTLVSAEWSTLLRPTVSKHGRGYIYANLDPKSELPERLRQLPKVYECVTNQGDAIWIPPWHWHKIDYNVGTSNESNETQLSIGASVFHFYPRMYFNMPLFAYLIVPNLIWEALGINVE